MSTAPDVQALVVGAGIGGLATAAFLRRVGMDPVVVERGDASTAFRGPVELGPQALGLLDRLDLGDGVRADGTAVTTWTRHTPEGTVTKTLECSDGSGFVAIEYAGLRARLLTAVPDDSLHTDTAVAALETTGESVTVDFANGVSEEFDAVIGADGVHSTVRTQIGGDAPDFCGTTSGAVPLAVERADADAGEVWTAEGAVFRVLPTGDRATGWLTVPTDVPTRNWGDDPSFQALRPDIDWLLPRTVDDREAWWIDDFRAPTDRWGEGRVALVGDAAHARHRLGGVGATLAIEDAAVLADELEHSSGPPAAGFAEYASRRRERIHRLEDRGGPEAPLDNVASILTDRCPTAPMIRGGSIAAWFDAAPPTDDARHAGR